MTSPFLLFQLADSAFPTGGFAHSSGIEAAHKLGEIDGERGLSRLLSQHLEQAGHASLPLVTAAHRAPERFSSVDDLCDATTLNHVANRASRTQGRAWLSTAASAFGLSSLAALRARCRDEGLASHLAPVFGAVSRLVGVERDDAQRLFLFLHLRGMVSSAVRLNLVGPLAAQALQHRMEGALLSVWERCRALDENDVTQTAPLLELFQGHHERLYSRLFSS